MCIDNLNSYYDPALKRGQMLGVSRQSQPALLYAQRLVPPSDLQLCRSLYSCTDSGRRPSRNEPRGRQPLQPRDHRPALDELPWYVLTMHRPLSEPLSEPLGGWPC